MITECTIYILVLGAITIGTAIWNSYLRVKNQSLEFKAAENELARVEAEGTARRLILENEQLYQELNECKRKRDGKGRYVKK